MACVDYCDIFSNEKHILYSYRVERTLDSKGQNCTTILFMAFSTTTDRLEAAIFVSMTFQLRAHLSRLRFTTYGPADGVSA